MQTAASDTKSIVSSGDVSQQRVWNASHAQDGCDILPTICRKYVARSFVYEGQRCALLTMKSRNT